MFTLKIVTALIELGLAGSPSATTLPSLEVIEELGRRTGFEPPVWRGPCGVASDCTDRGLMRFSEQATRLDRQDSLRILVLGDSHIAADYITDTARARLQSCLGDGGRGVMQPAQRVRFGGRLRAGASRWNRARIVDPGHVGEVFGLTGNALFPSQLQNGLIYRRYPSDQLFRLYVHGGSSSGVWQVTTGTVTVSVASPGDRLVEWTLPVRGTRVEVRSRSDDRLVGVAFDREGRGLTLESIGPVGAESQVFLQMDRGSFVAHLRMRRPDLILLFLGGNDALKLRKGWWKLGRVEGQFRELLRVLRAAVPEAACGLLSPMDAGRRVDGRIRGQAHIAEVRDLLRQLAPEFGCGFWDLFEGMGGSGSVARWARAGAMNAKDLVHPRRSGAHLIGWHLAESLLDAVRSERPGVEPCAVPP